MEPGEKFINDAIKSYRMSPDAWEKILDAARLEPLPVLVAIVWGLGKILDDRLSEMIKHQKTIEGVLKDIRAEIERANDRV